MSKSLRFLFALLSLLILGMMLLLHSSPPPLDWTPSYSQTDSRPMGAQVFYDLIRKVPGVKSDNLEPPINSIGLAPEQATFVIINQGYTSDPQETEELLSWVRKGGHLFVSARYFAGGILDSLGISAGVGDFEFPIEFNPLEPDSTTFSTLAFLDPLKSESPVVYDRFHQGFFFTWKDSLEVKVLGQIQPPSDSEELKPNFIQVPLEKGVVTLHAFPEAFSNYFMLHPEWKSYTEQVSGTWNWENPIILDQYIKDERSSALTPLSLILRNKYLSSAYYAAWVWVVLWVLFEGKRRQKVIKLIPPVKNQSLEFAKTIASIYFNRSDMTELGHLQIKLFWDFCRRTFYLNGDPDDPSFIEHLVEKSGLDESVALPLIEKIRKAENQTQLMSSDVELIQQHIEKFKSLYHHGRNLQSAN